jgi:hypothetical protein
VNNFTISQDPGQLTLGRLSKITFRLLGNPLTEAQAGLTEEILFMKAEHPDLTIGCPTDNQIMFMLMPSGDGASH